MSSDERDTIERRRFLVLTMARMGGVILLGFGLAVAMSDLVRAGGWPALGAILAAIGAVDTAVVPRLLKAAWDRRDGEGK